MYLPLYNGDKVFVRYKQVYDETAKTLASNCADLQKMGDLYYKPIDVMHWVVSCVCERHIGNGFNLSEFMRAYK